MTECQPWRLSSPAEIAPLLAAETAAWLDELGWDVEAAWRVVEPARRAGRLPGFVARDAGGRSRGWTSFVLLRNTLHVLAFSASDADTAARLIHAVLASPEAAVAQSLVFCVRSSALPWPKLLAQVGFQVEPYRYLRTTLDVDPGRRHGMQQWDDDMPRATRLLARAYRESEGMRAFAPHGTTEEWQDYVSGLVNGLGCGHFSPAMSFVVARASDGELDAAVITTDLGPMVAHIAQMAVDPSARGRGLGASLVRAAQSAAIAQGFRHMTLLVAASNQPAVKIYESLGFRDRAAFVVAVRLQPSLSTSLALATGGASTRL